MDYTSLIKEVNIPELVKALRCGEYKPECGSSGCPYWSGLGCMDGQLMEDAADAIESLQADVRKYHDAFGRISKTAVELEQRIAELKAVKSPQEAQNGSSR